MKRAGKALTNTDPLQLVIIPSKMSLHFIEQSINNVLMLKTFVDSIKPIWQALAGAGSGELQVIREVSQDTRLADVSLIEDSSATRASTSKSII